MFLDTECAACGAVSSRLIQEVAEGEHLGLDLYFRHAADDVATVQRWAQANGVPLELVTAGLITLNFDKGEFLQLQEPLGFSNDLPVVLKQQGDGYEIVNQS